MEPVVQDREAPELRIRNCESIEDMRETLASRVPVEVSATVAETAITAEGSHPSALPPDLRKQFEGWCGGRIRMCTQRLWRAS